MSSASRSRVPAPEDPSSDAGTCPVARALDVIGDRWSLLIARDAFDGPRRFGDFQRNLGVARNILADRLRRLVDAGILETRPAPDGTAYRAYALSAKGKDLFPVVVALRQWGEQHLFERGERHSVLVDRGSGRRVAPMRPRTGDGESLSPDDSIVRSPRA